MEIRAFHSDDTASIVSLWERCGLVRPWNDPRRDIERKSHVQPDGFLVATHEGRIVGSVMAGYEGHRGWINYLAVDPDSRRSGLGRALMQAAERWLLAMDCPKINLQIRHDNLEAIRFYERIGFVEDKVASFGKRLIPDS